MAELLEEFALALKAGHGPGIGAQAGADHLHSHGLFRLVVVALIDRAHGPVADLVVNVVRPNGLARQHDASPLFSIWRLYSSRGQTRMEHGKENPLLFRV